VTINLLLSCCLMYTRPVHGPYGPCTPAVYIHDRVHGLYTAVYMVVYTAVFTTHTGPLQYTRPCTRLCTRAVYICGRVHGLRTYTAVYRRVYTARTRPCTDRVHGRVQAVYSAHINGGVTGKMRLVGVVERRASSSPGLVHVDHQQHRLHTAEYTGQRDALHRASRIPRSCCIRAANARHPSSSSHCPPPRGFCAATTAAATKQDSPTLVGVTRCCPLPSRLEYTPY